MKKTKAFSLEEDVIETIENYKKKYKLSSASSALERIILVELSKRTDLDEIKNIIKNLKVNDDLKNEILIDEESKEKVTFKNCNLENSFKKSIYDMPD